MKMFVARHLEVEVEVESQSPVRLVAVDSTTGDGT
jgi:hypothetical protein